MSAAPLQIVNERHLNTRTNAVFTPTKHTAGKENQHLSSNKRLDHNNDQHRQPAQKKKKEKLSALCKTPPSLIKTRGRDYHRGHFLGEGGFARCFQIKDDSGKIFAAKTVAKISIKSEKTRKKLLSEIQIHKSMRHFNIVQFIDCFEDDTNVYILLEICPNGSLMDLLKRRKVLTEPEVRFFTTQIVGAVKYMHSRRVIHRDLKLGNIFFDKHYNLKIGDFGLAAVLANDRERKYTVCGTPNYIAPEVLTGKHTGHSYEVDIWSCGVMIYALLIGKPPFQAKEVNIIYERIKCGDYVFPRDKCISQEALTLIRDILSIDPLERPSLDEIIDYVWFRGIFPPRIDASVLSSAPSYENLDAAQSLANFKNCMAHSGLLSGSSSSTKDPIRMVKTDLEQEKSRTILPQSLSPGGTKNKYQEVVDLDAQRKLNDLAREARVRRAQQATIKKDLVATSTNAIKSEISLRILASECHLTLNGILEAEAQKRMGGLPKSRLPKLKNPIVVTKWVDYSNKHGFSYQLSTDDIGVLFNNGTTVLRLADAEEFWYISYDDREGWVASHYNLAERPHELARHLEVVDFFSKYMKANLSRISTFVREEYHKDDVFLRRYTRYKQYVMFELSDGTFQFNFKDHHKFAVSEGGSLITYISPDRESCTFPTVELLKTGEIPNHPEINFTDKLFMIKEGLKQKASIVSITQSQL
ncbi:Serine/threonine-protein kinase [Lachancea thermotolerans]|uniref:Serine/threonine-protein kinase n=1 Tax=Lachancea thermotolerans (strain ATCC 56472 / CBS 6340 / NRRL Y-8284) TaxID=559295 RepID=C5DEP4_LACTC|nr:KLTH0C10912p [Lachancea thermotolerans CBS 6340]CAR22255.1 KLTH0C10912p [Lachancea thermotolerans CBS 6340]